MNKKAIQKRTPSGVLFNFWKKVGFFLEDVNICFPKSIFDTVRTVLASKRQINDIENIKSLFIGVEKLLFLKL